MSHFRSYTPHCSHLHPPSPFFWSTTLTALQNTKLSHPSLSLHAMIMSWHRVQPILSTTYTEYSIHRSTAYTKYSIHREYSIHRVQHPPRIVCLPFILMITSWPLNVASACVVPPYTIHRHQPACHESSKWKSACHITTFASPLTDE